MMNCTIKIRPRRAFGKRPPAPRKSKGKPGRQFSLIHPQLPSPLHQFICVVGIFGPAASPHAPIPGGVAQPPSRLVALPAALDRARASCAFGALFPRVVPSAVRPLLAGQIFLSVLAGACQFWYGVGGFIKPNSRSPSLFPRVVVFVCWPVVIIIIVFFLRWRGGAGRGAVVARKRTRGGAATQQPQPTPPGDAPCGRVARASTRPHHALPLRAPRAAAVVRAFTHNVAAIRMYACILGALRVSRSRRRSSPCTSTVPARRASPQLAVRARFLPDDFLHPLPALPASSHCYLSCSHQNAHLVRCAMDAHLMRCAMDAHLLNCTNVRNAALQCDRCWREQTL